MLNIGCHLSSSKGFLHMGIEAASIGANTFQFFTRNPRGSKSKPVNLKDIERFKDFISDKNFAKIVAHAPYTMNACSADADIRKLAEKMMVEDIDIMEKLEGNYYNFHPGSHVKQGVETGIKYISDMLNNVLKKEQTTTVLLETMAGKGTEIGRNFKELRDILDRVKLKEKMGICLDTCHIWDGGYDIVNNLDGVLDEFDKIIGIDKLCAIHLNDSKNILASHKDRHETIGNGKIGIKAMERIINHPQLKNLPFELETPNDLEGYAYEIKLLRGLYND